MTEAPSSFKARPPAESTLSVWARRAVSVPLYGLLSAVCLGGLPVWAAATAAADLLLGPRGWPRTRALGFFALYLGSEVVGVLAAKMQAGDDNINRVIYVPFTTMSDIKDTHYLDSIWFNYETNDYERIEQSVRYIMAAQHKFNPTDRRALFVFNLMQQVHQFEIITLGLKILLALIGTLTLGIGGVGLMNIMLVSVTQRTREIGVEKALGARRRHIFLQFLAEALTITFIGGLLGIILAYVVAFSVGRLTLYSAMAKHAEAGDIRLMINPVTLVVAVLILTAVGLISGMVPAIRASRLDPIEALRYE